MKGPSLLKLLKMKKILLILSCYATLFVPFFFVSCSEEDNAPLDIDNQVEQDNSTEDQINADNSTTDSTDTSGSDPAIAEEFSRALMLTNWADNIIIPSLEKFVLDLDSLVISGNRFTTDPNQVSLTKLRESWLNAYLSWQSVDMFDIGKAEEITLRNYINVFPLDANGMTESLLSGNYDLSSVNRQDEQGFSALDYLLFGLSGDDDKIIDFYTEEVQGDLYKKFLTDIIERMQYLSSLVLQDWKNDFRDQFIERDGSSATESVNSMVNDYIYYYEKFLRAGKIGIPAGVFSGSPLSDRVEAKYSGVFSKELFSAALNASQDFFNGVHFDKSDTGVSLQSWIIHLAETEDTNNLSGEINENFDLVRTQLNNLSENFRIQVESDNLSMLQTYDMIQENVVLMKVDMLQLFDIKVDYIDADGD